MATGAFASKLILAAAALNGVVAVISTEWAVPANTLLLIILALVSRQNGKKIDRNTDHVIETKNGVDEAKVNATHAASAAAAAAAAAATAARITQEVGGAIRSIEVPAAPAPETNG
jgi:Na+-transporting methylmalonyl-CoA/oxaloacetate decarboxylase gamma subunit